MGKHARARKAGSRRRPALKAWRWVALGAVGLSAVFLATCGASPGPYIAVRARTPAAKDCALRVHFYDVGQGLAVLLDLPDGRHVLVDAGNPPHRRGCGESCEVAHTHLIDALRRDLRGKPLDLLWITHQHDDHIGGAPDVLRTIGAKVYVDNGRDASKAEVVAAHEAAAAADAQIDVVDPDHRAVPLAAAEGETLVALVPAAWPGRVSQQRERLLDRVRSRGLRELGRVRG